MGYLLNFKKNTLKRIFKIAAASAAGLLVLIIFSIISFNKLWIQSMPQGNLIFLAELELARLKIPACKNPGDFKIGAKPWPQSHCRWWRLPREKGKYCGHLNEILKIEQNCLEIFFDRNANKETIDIFIKSFKYPCQVLRNFKQEISYETIRQGIRCDRGEEYIRFTAYILQSENSFNEEENIFIDYTENIKLLKKIERTNAWRFFGF
ncbi:hypothetical protein [Stappia sp. 28M-7]|uniref:hypothetical protein n=1 Tax=Stappia sp. 28M-7 TaxID=2762596 RepID=UPI00163BBC99|nr:hypothetical protein [Stappia sp. 28M-7]MBC2859849.1 hypothetical protein [Stappia sp. 28M-7]